MRSRVPLLLLALLIAACIAPARADDESDRRDIMEDIEDALDDATDELEDVAGASSSSPVSSAQRYIESIPNLVDKLARVKGDDSTANRIVDRYRDYVSLKEAEAAIDAAAQLLNGAAKDDSDDDIEAALNKAADVEGALGKLGATKGNDPRANEIADKWPAHVTAYKAALAPLLELKRAQFGLDGEVKKCQAADQALVDYVAQYKDAAGIVAIEQKATDAQKTTNDMVAKWKEQGGKMDGWNTDAQRLQISDGKWTYLSGYVRSAAQGSLDHWKAALKAAETACENTTRPAVECPPAASAWPTTSASTATATTTSARSAHRATTASAIRRGRAARVTTTPAIGTRTPHAPSHFDLIPTKGIRRWIV